MGGKEPLKTDLSLSESALPKNTVRDDLQIPQDTEGEQGDYHYPQQDVCPFVRTQTALLHIAQGKVKNQRRKERAYAQQRRIIPPRRRKIARQKAQAHFLQTIAVGSDLYIMPDILRQENMKNVETPAIVFKKT